MVGTGPVNISGLPSSSLNFVVPLKTATNDQSIEKIRMYTSTKKNNILVVDRDDTMSSQGNGELIHRGPHTIVPYLIRLKGVD